MTTKEKILQEALSLFSVKGYDAVYVGEIAEAVGIKAPSLYKHFKSKRDIFDAILEEIKTSYERQAEQLHCGKDETEDAKAFSEISEEELVQAGSRMFLHFLHDEYTRKFRRMLTIEQYRNRELALLYSRQYADDPLSYQSAVFSLMLGAGVFRPEDPYIMAMHFYAPIYLLLTMCDRQPEREQEALEVLEKHIRQFSRLYQKGEETK